MSSRISALDGMRGIAAMAVLGLHSTHGEWPANGGLAVDLFFILSGFVLAMVYEERFKAGMTSGQFLVARLARLYPVYIFGSALALLMSFPHWRGEAVAAFVHNAVFLPYGGKHGALCWLDGPLWSLCFEMGVNVLFGLGLWKLPSRAMALLVAASALVLLMLTVTTGTMNYGWQPDPGSYLLGFARIGFGFPLGWLIWRHREAIRPYVDAPAISWLALFAAAATFCVPGGAWMVVATLLVYPPAVAALALGRQPSGRLQQLALVLGALSYPLYATHALVLEMIWTHAGRNAGWMAWLAAPAVAWLLHKTVEPYGRAFISRLAGWKAGGRAAMSANPLS